MPMVIDSFPHMQAPRDLEARFLEPPGFRWGSITAADGVSLRWGHLAAGSDRDCFVLGGFLEFIEKHFETMRDFHARGFNVWSLDWRGQGLSDRGAGTRPGARAFGGDARDLAQFIGKVSPRPRKRLIVPHSMGGAIALLALGTYPGIADAAVLSAPMLGINTGNKPRWAARLFVALMARIGRGGDFVPGAGAWPDLAPRFPKGFSRVSNDPARSRLLDAWFTANAGLRQDGPTHAWLNAAFGLTSALARRGFLKEVETPVLMGSAGDDLIVDPAAHIRAARFLPHCRLVRFPKAKHELFHEADSVRNEWLAAIDAFLASEFG